MRRGPREWPIVGNVSTVRLADPMTAIDWYEEGVLQLLPHETIRKLAYHRFLEVKTDNWTR
jgi:hypothetical protein